MGQPTNEQAPTIVLDIATIKGVDGTTDPYQVSPQNLVDCANFLPDQGYGALTTALGRGKIPQIGDLELPGPCNGIGYFNRFNPFTTSPPVYVFAIDLPGGGSLWYIPVDGSLPLTQLALPGMLPLTPGQQTFFAEAGVWLFISNGTDTPLKIDNTLLVTQWGISKPATAPTLTGTTGGKLSFGEAPYYYCVTFGHAKTGFLDPGQESSQGAISDPITLGQTPGAGSFTYDSSISGEPQGHNYQFTLVLGGAQYPYGEPYVTIGGDDAARAANLTAQLINQAAPLAYQKPNGDAGVLTVTATTTATPGQVSISVADSTGFALNSAAGYIQYFVYDEHAPSGGPYHVAPNQSGPANVTGGSSDDAVQLSAIPLSTDPQVTERNIYRLGGGLGQWRLVATLNDNTTTTYLDTLADNKVTGQALVVFRDSPPPFAYICSFQQRIFGFNTLNAPTGGSTARNNSSSLWWSNLDEPWGFNELNNTLTVGESLEGDPGIGLGSLGTVLGICKKKGFYALWGNSDATFSTGLYKVADTGCVSAQSIACAYGMMGWVSRQGVYFWNGMGLPMNMSDGQAQQSNVKNVFDAATIHNLGTTVGFWYGRMYGFSINNPTQRTYLYDFRTQGWWPLPYFMTQVYYDITTDTPVVAVRGGVTGPNQFVDAWFIGATDLGQPVAATGTSRIFADPGFDWGKTLASLLFDVPAVSGSFSFVLITDQGVNETVWPLPVPIPTSQGFPRKRVQLPETEYVDAQLTFTLTTDQGAVPLSRLSVYAIPQRRLAPEDATVDQ